MQIIKDASNPTFDNRLDVEVKNWFDNYVKDPLVRTIDSIPNNQVFLTQLYLMSKMKMIELPDKAHLEEFFDALSEEELRRHTLAFDPTTVNAAEMLLPVLNVDKEI